MSEGDFNRTAEALIRRSVMEDNPGVDVKAIDGRGGDGGIDLDARVERSGHQIAIYQLKFFPEGFSGEWARSRKPQIRKSFDAALQHEPPAWYLVVPRNLTPKERSFVTSLRAKRARPMTRYIGAAELDALIVRYPDIEDWAQRNPLRSALELAGRASAALSEPSDLGHEVMDLARRTRARSEYWDVNFSRRGSVFTEELVALRDDSDVREPLSLTLTTNFTENPELGVAFKRTLEFGGTEPLILPESVVRSLERHGPEWFARADGPGVIELHPQTVDVDVSAAVTLLNSAEQALGTRNAIRVRRVGGSRGGQLIVELGDNLQFTFLIRSDDSNKGELNFTMNLAGLTGQGARRVLRFLSDLAVAASLKLDINGKSTMVLIGPDRYQPEILHLELADDLAFIEDQLNITVSYPATLPPNEDRIWIRAVRHLLEGKVSIMPRVEGMNFILNGEREPALDQLLADGGAVMRSTDAWGASVLGQELQLGDISMLMPNAVVVDADEHIAAISAGRGANRKINLVAADGKGGVLIWSPSRIGDLEVLTPTPWGITGIAEHKQLRSVEESDVEDQA